jgi:hypothetical protein
LTTDDAHESEHNEQTAEQTHVGIDSRKSETRQDDSLLTEVRSAAKHRSSLLCTWLAEPRVTTIFFKKKFGLKIINEIRSKRKNRIIALS